jgi:outer membrane protein TolC
MPFPPLAFAGWPSRATAGAAALLVAGCGGVRHSRFAESAVAPPSELARTVAAQPDTARGGAAEPPPGAAAAPPEAPPPAPRSLADLLDLALRQDPSTRAAWQDARVASAQAAGRRSLYLPSLSAEAGIDRVRGGGSQDRPASTDTVASVGASISWLLLDLTRGALVNEADRLAAAAQLGEHTAVADLVLRVQETYFRHLGVRALVEAQTAAVRQAEASLNAAEERRRAGVATVADVLQARTALSQARLLLQQYEGQALVVRGELATLAGLPPTAELEVGALPARVAPDEAEPAIEALLERARARNPDLGQARALADAAAARARAAARAPWPVLSFQAGAARSWALVDGEPEPGVDLWSFGLALRLPTIQGLRPAYDVLAARASAEAARARAEATGQRVALDVWTSFQSLRTAGRRVETARDLVDSAEASADVARGRYQEGVGSILDLLAAQAALEEAHAEDVRARFDYLVAVARLSRASGRLELPPPPAEGAPTPESPAP